MEAGTPIRTAVVWLGVGLCRSVGVSRGTKHTFEWDQMMISLIWSGLTHIETRAIHFQDEVDKLDHGSVPEHWD